jgi:GTP-binding protein HflX
VLVVVTAGRDRAETDASTEELRELASSANVAVVDVLVQNRPQPDPRTVIGSGKLQDLAIRCFQSDVDLVIFDDDLSGTQARNLAEALDLRVIDRTQLILDIFAQRATSRDGKLQVELAQLKYTLPRLAQSDTSLSRLGGGIGTRGPGETKLEMDRRKIKGRMSRLKKDLEQIRNVRSTQRRSRKFNGQYLAALIGYTNAGKSTLLNRLSHAGVVAEDRLFSTLDPTIRRLQGVGKVLLSDTVGFIRKLPHQLIAAFKATLEEVAEASLLLLVVDISSPFVEEQVASVNAVLQEMGIQEKDTLYVLNKIDRVPEPGLLRLWQRRLEPAVAISARTGAGIEDLIAYINSWMTRRMPRVCLRLPLSEGSAIDRIYKNGTVLHTEYRGADVLLEAQLDYAVAQSLRRFSIPPFRKKHASGRC